MYVKIIKQGCPICKGDVKGNFTNRYLCIKCNVSFKYTHLLSKKITGLKTDDPKLEWMDKK